MWRRVPDWIMLQTGSSSFKLVLLPSYWIIRKQAFLHAECVAPSLTYNQECPHFTPNALYLGALLRRRLIRSLIVSLYRTIKTRAGRNLIFFPGHSYQVTHWESGSKSISKDCPNFIDSINSCDIIELIARWKRKSKCNALALTNLQPKC